MILFCSGPGTARHDLEMQTQLFGQSHDNCSEPGGKHQARRRRGMIRSITPSIPIPPPVDSTVSGSSIKQASTALYPSTSSDTVARITNIRADVSGISTSPTTGQVIAS
jgi:hypothetical protein